MRNETLEEMIKVLEKSLDDLRHDVRELRKLVLGLFLALGIGTGGIALQSCAGPINAVGGSVTATLPGGPSVSASGWVTCSDESDAGADCDLPEGN